MSLKRIWASGLRALTNLPHGVRGTILAGIVFTGVACVLSLASTAGSHVSQLNARLALAQELAIKLLRRDTEDLGARTSIGDLDFDPIDAMIFSHDADGYWLSRPGSNLPKARLETPPSGIFGATLDLPGDAEFVILTRDGTVLNQVWHQDALGPELRRRLTEALAHRRDPGRFAYSATWRFQRGSLIPYDLISPGMTAIGSIAEVPRTNLLVATIIPSGGWHEVWSFPVWATLLVGAAWLLVVGRGNRRWKLAKHDLIGWLDEAFGHFAHGREIVPAPLEGFHEISECVSSQLAAARLKSRAFSEREMDPALRWLTWKGFLKRTLQQYRAGAAYHGVLAIRYAHIADPARLGQALVACKGLREWSMLSYRDDLVVVGGPASGQEAAHRQAAALLKEAIRLGALRPADFRAHVIVETARDAQRVAEIMESVAREVSSQPVADSIFGIHLTVAPPPGRPGVAPVALSGTDLMGARSEWVLTGEAAVATPPPPPMPPSFAAPTTVDASSRLQAGALLFLKGQEREAVAAWKEAISLSLRAPSPPPKP